MERHGTSQSIPIENVAAVKGWGVSASGVQHQQVPQALCNSHTRDSANTSKSSIAGTPTPTPTQRPDTQRKLALSMQAAWDAIHYFAVFEMEPPPATQPYGQRASAPLTTPGWEALRKPPHAHSAACRVSDPPVRQLCGVGDAPWVVLRSS